MSTTTTSAGTWCCLRWIMLGPKWTNSTSSATIPGLSEVGTTCTGKRVSLPLLVHTCAVNEHCLAAGHSAEVSEEKHEGGPPSLAVTLTEGKSGAPRVWTAADGGKALMMGCPFSLPEDGVMHKARRHVDQVVTANPPGNMRFRKFKRVSHKCLNFTEATCRNVQFCSTLPALGSAAARNYCKLTGLTWARRRVSAWHGRQCAGSCKAAVRFGGLSSWACFWQVLAKRQWKAMQLSAEHESQQKFWSSGCA